MALKKSALKRVFILSSKGQEVKLADPNPDMSPDEVMVFYSNTYPELVTSTCQGPSFKEDRMLFHFKTTVGSKG